MTTRVLAVISEIRRTAQTLKASGDEATEKAGHLSEMMSALEAHWQGIAQVHFYVHYAHDSVRLKRFGLDLIDIGVLLDKVADEIIYFDEHLLAEETAVDPSDPNLPWKIDPTTGTVHHPDGWIDPDDPDQVGGDDHGTVTQPGNGSNGNTGGQPVGGDPGQGGTGGGTSGGAGWTPPPTVGGNDPGPGGTQTPSGGYAGYAVGAGVVGGVAAGAAAAGASGDSSDDTSGDTVAGGDQGTTDDADKPATEGEKFWGRFKGLTSDPKAGWGCVSYVLSSTFVPWTMIGHWNAGNAKEWVRNAQRWNQLHPEYGITVDHTPRPGAVAVFPDWGGGYGHVAKVTKTNGKDFSFLQGNTFFGSQETPQGHYFNNKGELDVPYLLNGSVETSGHNEVWFIHFPWSEG